MKLTTREKVLITILLAVIASWLFGCCRYQERFVRVGSPATESGLPDAAYFQKAYAAYNEGYFHNRLPQVINIDTLEPNDKFMASTMCDDTGRVCDMHFNLKYVAATRVADITLKHEMCHVAKWMKDMDSLGVQVDHGKNWRSCMLQLDMQGAFRQDLIDGYWEDM